MLDRLSNQLQPCERDEGQPLDPNELSDWLAILVHASKHRLDSG
jgi:hypothetical protein